MWILLDRTCSRTATGSATVPLEGNQRMGVIDGRVAIITGGARGIGASISRLFAREGASVVINDLGGAPDGTGGDQGPAKQIADEITAAGGRAVSDGGDIGDVATGERLVRTAVE